MGRRAAKAGHKVIGLTGYENKSKGGGDAARNSKVEPYAYMRLNPKMMKEKKKSKALSSISKVVQKAKAGALKGAKAKAFQARRMKSKAKSQKGKKGKGKTRK